MRYDKIDILNVTADNVADAGIYCIKDKTSFGFKSKVLWFNTVVSNRLINVL